MKLTNIQIGRGIAAILVVFHHLYIPQLKSIYPESFIFKHLNTSFIGDFSVYFFFCISGYVMMLSCHRGDKTPLHFIKDRISRIYPIYIFWTLFFILFYFLTKSSFPWLIRLNYIPKNSLEYIHAFSLIPPLFNGENFATPLATAWSLVYEVFFYIIFALLLVFIEVRKIPTFLIVLFFISFLTINSLFGPGRHRWVFLPYIVSDLINICFAVGASLFYVRKINIDSNLKKYCPYIIFLILIGLSLLKNIYNEKVSLIVLTCVTFYLLLNTDFKDSPLQRFFSYLGDASYSIYLTHIAFSSLSWIAIKKGWEFGLILTLSSIVFGCASFKYIEKPLTKFIRKLFLQRTNNIPYNTN
ncbi:acyltransferase [Paramixta manurensis]|uniref:Acyltransferase n=1 Tax=Paramixta manurensis TaxID=2740817 RepID=A0A6M8UGH2_9GAMM|nr:acyltransferase [Erwiniaceae bacterium PD-1]